MPSPFQAFHRARSDAEYRGGDAFDWNGKTYARGEWSNGVPVWKRV